MQQNGDIAARLRDLPREELRLLLVLGRTFLVNQYDMALIGLALPQIQAELGVSEAAVGPFVGATKLGVVGALLLALAADRAGRRSLLLVTLLGFTGFTTLTAFARTPAEFLVLQFGARACIAAEEVIAIVLVAEQINARARGPAFGVLAIFGALGHGVAAIGYGFIESLPFGWRALYAAAAVPLLLLAWIRRSLRESDHFEAARQAQSREAFAPLRELFVSYPVRLLSLLTAIFSFGFFAAPALGSVSKTLQDLHGWTPPEVTLLIVGGGSFALVAYPIAGILSDRFGRRRILSVGLVANAAGVCAFYLVGGPALVSAWIGMMVGFMACDVLFGALGAELFPTTHRATASAMRMLALSGGGVLGFAIEGFLYVQQGSLATALVWMTVAAPLSLFAVRALPETALRELEFITDLDSARQRVVLRDPKQPEGESP